MKSRPYCGSTWAQHEQCGTAEGTGYTAGTGHTAQPHGAHSQEWLEPHHDPHVVGNGFGNEKTFDPAGMCFRGVVLQKW